MKFHSQEILKLETLWLCNIIFHPQFLTSYVPQSQTWQVGINDINAVTITASYKSKSYLQSLGLLYRLQLLFTYTGMQWKSPTQIVTGQQIPGYIFSVNFLKSSVLVQKQYNGLHYFIRIG